MDIKGKVIAVLPKQEGTASNGNHWERQTIVVEYQDGQYTSKVALDNAKKASEFGKLNIGDECTFKCNTPTSREYNGRWYTSVNCWGWDVENKAEAVAESQSMSEPTPQPTATAEPTTKADDDIPF
jgi:hypothetical protein